MLKSYKRNNLIRIYRNYKINFLYINLYKYTYYVIGDLI